MLHRQRRPPFSKVSEIDPLCLPAVCRSTALGLIVCCGETTTSPPKDVRVQIKTKLIDCDEHHLFGDTGWFGG